MLAANHILVLQFEQCRCVVQQFHDGLVVHVVQWMLNCVNFTCNSQHNLQTASITSHHQLAAHDQNFEQVRVEPFIRQLLMVTGGLFVATHQAQHRVFININHQAVVA